MARTRQSARVAPKRSYSSINMVNLQDPDEYHDRVLIVGDKKFYVVSAVLSMWSDYFSAMFDGNFKEAEKKEIKLKDVDSNAVEQCLKIFYDSSLADFGADLLIPLIDLSFFFLAPKVMDSCRKFIDKSLKTIDGKTVVKLLDKTCEMNIDDLKEKIVNYLKCDTVMDTIGYRQVVACANSHELKDLKTWIGNYLAKNVSPRTVSGWLDYSVDNDLPTLKAAIINKVPTWNQNPMDYQRSTGLVQPLIPEESIIGLMQSAFKHNIDPLKTILRKRIYYMARASNRTFYDRVTYQSNFLSINTFLEKNMANIFALPKDVCEYIVTSSVRDT